MAKIMKAAFYEEFGAADKIIVGNLTVPELKEGEVLVRVKAAGINPVDAAVREGYLHSFIPVVFPAIPGWDVAGVVEDRGYSARRFKPGDEVYAYARRPLVQHGTFAEYLVIPESYLALRPQQISWEEAAGIPLVGLTAFQSLFDAGNLQENQSVLILGASGGVGSLAIQLAKAKGATVVGVASRKNQDHMRNLGADYTIDYNNARIADAVKEILTEGVDLIFDCASGETLQQSLAALKSGGKLVSILNRGENLPHGINFEYVFVEPNSTQLNHLRELADSGKLKVPVSQTFTLEETQEAFAQIETHHTTGKIIITP